ncbi:hypothetical protein C723_3020 [Christiangramia flava JLT2011]|nr:hypothetical protein C723_3020 [Christiangramia flava JLT2011]
MVIIGAITANRVTTPKKINMEQTTSANIVRNRENPGLRPITPGNCISPPDNSICNFGIPCVSISAATAALRTNSTASTCEGE